MSPRFGNRKPPSAAYGGESPVLYYDDGEEVWVGGMFWDGRASGWTLGDPLAEQAQGPFLNAVEQNVADAHAVCITVRDAEYASLFEEVWGTDSLDCENDVEATYERIARSIAAYERSVEVNPFSSKFDAFWDNANGAGLDVTAITMANWTQYKDLGLDDEELHGLALFNDENKGQCSACHLLEPGESGRPLFTDFTYDNLGVPKNEFNPWYAMEAEFNPDGADWIDYGLGAFLKGEGRDPQEYEDQMGKQKVPTLRNVDLRPSPDFVKAYTHNGFFKSLEDVVHFYNTRDVDATWAPPEVPANVNSEELGDLRLTADEETLIVTFMKTLSDGYTTP
jgi:cytochrome c peroxidase